MRKNTAESFWASVDRRGENECWEWKKRHNEQGYGYVKWNHKDRRAHRVAYELVFGLIPDGMEVCHTCDNPPCCNPSHFFLGTHQDNMRDMEKKGRRAFGERVGSTKLSLEQVSEIRKRYASGKESTYKLAKEFPVSHQQIYDIVTNKSWKSKT